MPTSLATPPAEKINARAYLRAHTGKLMIIERSEGRERSAADFFHIEDVGTHPTGLLVTGIFDKQRRGHMLASSVRDANAAEIAWQLEAASAPTP